MSLLEIYKEKNKSKKWFDDHSSLAKGAAGRMFEYTNTNFRSQKTFTEDFVKFLEIENKPRKTWPKQKDHGQEVHKHLVVNMLQSKLFKKDVSGMFSRTEKGSRYSDFVDLELGDNEKWLVNYLFLVNGYYFNRKNYIIYRVKEDLLGYLLSVDRMTEDLLIKEARELLKLDDTSFDKIIRSHFLYIHSFYDDADFLINYFRSPKNEKEELTKYIEDNINAKDFKCCISKKYQKGGNFNGNMLFDETRVFIITLLFIQTKNVNLINIYDVFVENFYKNISTVNKKVVFNYLHKNKEVFGPIFEDILEIEELETEVSEKISIGAVEMPIMPVVDTAESYIDETTETGRARIKAIYNLKKSQAKIQGGYTCALEKINNCKPIYFTAKINGKNYLETHHFIPREFRNDFSYSIEVLANYITLCPRCHRQIHLAVDRERKHLINSIFEERKGRLEHVGLKLELVEIYEYYKIDV